MRMLFAARWLSLVLASSASAQWHGVPIGSRTGPVSSSPGAAASEGVASPATVVRLSSLNKQAILAQLRGSGLGLPEYYVSPDAGGYIPTEGNDSNAGTFAAPWKTLGRAATLLQEAGRAIISIDAGDIVDDFTTEMGTGPGGKGLQFTLDGSCIGDASRLCAAVLPYGGDHWTIDCDAQDVTPWGAIEGLIRVGDVRDVSSTQGWVAIVGLVDRNCDAPHVVGSGFGESVDIVRVEYGSRAALIDFDLECGGTLDQCVAMHGGGKALAINGRMDAGDDGVTKSGGEVVALTQDSVLVSVGVHYEIHDAASQNHMFRIDQRAHLFELSDTVEFLGLSTSAQEFVYRPRITPTGNAPHVTLVDTIVLAPHSYGNDGTIYPPTGAAGTVTLDTYKLTTYGLRFWSIQGTVHPDAYLAWTSRCSIFQLDGSLAGGGVAPMVDVTDTNVKGFDLFSTMDVRSSVWDDEAGTRVWRFQTSTEDFNTLEAAQANGSYPASWSTCVDDGNCLLGDADSVDLGGDGQAGNAFDGEVDLSTACPGFRVDLPFTLPAFLVGQQITSVEYPPGPAGATDIPRCQDAIDDDGDGLVDYPADSGCARPASLSESPACQDGLDNDHQAGIDFDGGASLDLDGDGFIDASFNPDTPAVGDPDPECTAPYLEAEAPASLGCGLGAELPLVLGVLWWRRRRSGRTRR